jgi:L-lactate permease
LGIPAAASPAQRVQRPDELAGPAQRDPAHAARSAKATQYGAVYNFTWLSASGTACLLAAILGAMVAGLSIGQFGRGLRHTARQLALVAAAATSMKREDEGRLFRLTLRHSIFLASVIGLLVMFYAYLAPAWAP